MEDCDELQVQADGDPIQLPSERLQENATSQPEQAICDNCDRLDLPGFLRRVSDASRAHPNGKSGFSWPYVLANVGDYYRRAPETDCPLCPIFFASRCSYETDVLQRFVFRKAANSNNDFILILPCSRRKDLGYGIPKDHRNSFELYVAAPVSDDEDVMCYEIAVPVLHFNPVSPTSNESSFFPATFLFPSTRPHVEIFQNSIRTAIGIPRKVPPQFHPQQVIRWMQYCKKHHTVYCRKPASAIPGLQVIDCQTLSIRDANVDDHYVALSYVWGAYHQQANSYYVENKRLLRTALPLVITDAILVTEALGYRYLWVDRYCIDQNDSPERSTQIKHMDSVYANAALTIIAGSGSDDTYGLSGVSSRSRTSHASFQYQGINVVWAVANPDVSLESSHWNTRGWTFQEGVLSRRRLLFTNEEVYFECNTMCCWESININLNHLHVKNRWKLRGAVRQGIFKDPGRLKRGSSPSSLAETLMEYIVQVEEYTKRNLSHDSDSLNAFQGIIRQFSTRRFLIRTLWGIPYPYDSDRRQDWFLLMLTWWPAERTRRRNQFPSWAWTGWQGFCSMPPPELSPINVATRSLLCEDKRGQLLELQDIDGLDGEACVALHITAAVIPLTIVKLHSPPDGASLIQWEVAGILSDFVFSSSENQFANDLNNSSGWRCIYITESFGKPTILVLKSCPIVGSWSRVGLFRLPLSPEELFVELSSEIYWATSRII